SRFLFAEICSELRSSEISSLINLCLDENEQVSLASTHYYLYFNKKMGTKFFWGRKIVGFPRNLPPELFYLDFGGESFSHFEGVPINLDDLKLEQIGGQIAVWEEKFDQKIEKMLLSIDAKSL